MHGEQKEVGQTCSTHGKQTAVSHMVHVPACPSQDLAQQNSDGCPHLQLAAHRKQVGTSLALWPR
jgi:hypothetical protein